MSPERWAAAHPQSFRETVVTMYGREVPVLVASCVGMAYRSLPGRPWYAVNERPSFTEMIATLRRVSWAEEFVDPPSGSPPRQKTLAAYLARVVAAA